MNAKAARQMDRRHPSILVILDYDGVIVDSKDLDARLFVKALKDNDFYGINTVDEMVALGDGNLNDCLQKMGLSEAEIGKVYTDYAEMMAHTSEKAPLFRGVREVLQELYKIAYIYVVTTNMRIVVERALGDNRITCYDGILGSEHVKSKEQKIRLLLNHYPGLKSFYVGDNKKDMVEAHRAGVIPIAAEWGWHSVGLLPDGEPAFYLKNPQMLPYLLKRLHSVNPDNGTIAERLKEA